MLYVMLCHVLLCYVMLCYHWFNFVCLKTKIPLYGVCLSCIPMRLHGHALLMSYE